MRVAPFLLSMVLCTTAIAHDYWGNGQEVDRATKDLCCGRNDCKEIMPDHMHVGGDGLVRFDDVPLTVPASRIMPSPDGRIWRCIWGSQIKCLFAPLSGS